MSVKISVNKVEFKVDGKYEVIKLPIGLSKKEALSQAKEICPTGEFTRQWIGKEEEELRVQSIPVSESKFVDSVLKSKNKKEKEDTSPMSIVIDSEDEVFSEYEAV